MPNPNNFDSEDDFMGECIPQLVDEGKDQDQAVAICSSMWRNRKDGNSQDEEADEIVIEIIL